MPAIEAMSSTQSQPQPAQSQIDPGQAELKFPPVTKDHILHCSYDFWFPKYRTSCIRSRVIPLSPEFISYIREDGIILADDEPDTKPCEDGGDDDDDWEPTNPSTRPPPRGDEEGDSSDSDDDDDERPAKLPPNQRFPDLHNSINAAIQALGGAVAPKLNWSSPKDATWISRHPNTMKCTSANDIYILLKSSSFISHDLDHSFDDTTATAPSAKTFSPVLVLRAFFNPLPSLEFRCFVKDRNLVAITQRDLNYYEFLKDLRPAIVNRIKDLFSKMRFTFPDSSWVFDVYIPEAYYAHDTDSESDADDNELATARRNDRRLAKARLIDINPWAPRTDTLLFGWDELLNIHVARPFLGSAEEAREADNKSKYKTVRIPIRLLSGQPQAEGAAQGEKTSQVAESKEEAESSGDDIDADNESHDGEESGDDEWEEEHEPELRLVEHDDPAAYNFSSPQYSAHKLPKEVVDASMAGDGGMREFARRWQRLVEGTDRG